MGTLALAAKITHVPSMYLSELDGPHKGCREAAIEGHREIGRRCRALGVDTIVVFDVHWLVNSEYHLNCAERFEGVYTSNELPHFIKNLSYAYPGNPALGHLDPPHPPSDKRPRLEISLGINADRWLCATVRDLRTRKLLMGDEPVVRLL